MSISISLSHHEEEIKGDDSDLELLLISNIPEHAENQKDSQRVSMRRVSQPERMHNSSEMVIGLAMAAVDISMASTEIMAPKLSHSFSGQHLSELEIIEEQKASVFRRRSSVQRRTKLTVHKLIFMLIIHQFARGITTAAVLKIILKDTGDDPASISFYWTIISSIQSFCDIVLSPVRSHFADEYGRKPMLYISLAGYAASSIMVTVYSSMYTIFAAAIISNMFSLLFTTVTSMLGDVLPAQPHILSQTMAKVGVISAVMYGAGFGAGILYVYFDHYLFLCFLLQAILECLAIVAVYSMPETVKKIQRDSKNMYIFSESISKESRAITESYLMHTEKEDEAFTWNVCKSIKLYLRILRVDERIKWLTISGFMASIGSAGGLGAMSAFAIEKFGWGEVELAIYMLIGGVCGAISSLCSGRLHLLFGSYSLMKYSLIWSCICTTVAAFSQNFYWFYAALFLSVPIGFQYELSKGAYIMSITPSMFQARINTAGAIMGSIATVIFTNAYSFVFWYFTSDDAFVYFPGAAIFMAAIFRAFAYPFLLKLPAKHKPEDMESNIDDVVDEDVLHVSKMGRKVLVD